MIETFLIIVFVLFSIYFIISFYEVMIIALVNLVLGGMILLRIIHDMRDKKSISIYIASFGISFLIFYLNPKVFSFLSRFSILFYVQFAIMVFLIAQVLIFFSKKLG